MGIRAVTKGPIGEVTAGMVREVRERRQLTQRDLSVRLGELGRPMLPSVVAKIEAGDRRVDVDDLVALSIALNVQPGRLLLRDTAGDDEVPLTPTSSTPGWCAWDWVRGMNPIPSQPDHTNTYEELQRFAEETPIDLRERENHPVTRQCKLLWYGVMRVVHHATKPPQPSVQPDLGLATTLKTARLRLGTLSAELDQIEAAGLAEKED
jgi:transcriptional regulator with XRE-family HTH domain